MKTTKKKALAFSAAGLATAAVMTGGGLVAAQAIQHGQDAAACAALGKQIDRVAKDAFPAQWKGGPNIATELDAQGGGCWTESQGTSYLTETWTPDDLVGDVIETRNEQFRSELLANWNSNLGSFGSAEVTEVPGRQGKVLTVTSDSPTKVVVRDDEHAVTSSYDITEWRDAQTLLHAIAEGGK